MELEKPKEPQGEPKEAVDLLDWFLAIDLIPITNRRTKDSKSLYPEKRIEKKR